MTDIHYTNRERKALIDRISQLGPTEHEEILKIIKLHCQSVSYSQNRNGVFINFRTVPSSIVEKIENFVEFCYENKQHLDEYDKRINECKLNNKFLNLNSQEQTNDLTNTNDPQPLNVVMKSLTQSHVVDSLWQETLRETKERQKLECIMDVLENNYAKIHKKRACSTKYANAKKKYARKVTSDKRCETDLASILQPEPYVIG